MAASAEYSMKRKENCIYRYQNHHHIAGLLMHQQYTPQRYIAGSAHAFQRHPCISFTFSGAPIIKLHIATLYCAVRYSQTTSITYISFALAAASPFPSPLNPPMNPFVAITCYSKLQHSSWKYRRTAMHTVGRVASIFAGQSTQTHHQQLFLQSNPAIPAPTKQNNSGAHSSPTSVSTSGCTSNDANTRRYTLVFITLTRDCDRSTPITFANRLPHRRAIHPHIIAVICLSAKKSVYAGLGSVLPVHCKRCHRTPISSSTCNSSTVSTHQFRCRLEFQRCCNWRHIHRMLGHCPPRRKRGIGKVSPIRLHSYSDIIGPHPVFETFTNMPTYYEVHCQVSTYKAYSPLPYQYRIRPWMLFQGVAKGVMQWFW